VREDPKKKKMEGDSAFTAHELYPARTLITPEEKSVVKADKARDRRRHWPGSSRLSTYGTSPRVLPLLRGSVEKDAAHTEFRKGNASLTFGGRPSTVLTCSSNLCERTTTLSGQNELSIKKKGNFGGERESHLGVTHVKNFTSIPKLKG